MQFATRSSGPRSARVMIVGEAPGVEEENQGFPFVGSSGMELTRMLNETGFIRNECYITNVCKYRPPKNKIELWWKKLKNPPRNLPLYNTSDGHYYNDHVQNGLAELDHDLRDIKPNIVICLGNLALWALTGNVGITKWAGSTIWSERYEVKVCPTIHPASILRQWSQRPFTIQDLQRFYVESKSAEFTSTPLYRFTIRPTFDRARSELSKLLGRVLTGPTKISVDLETRAGHIACIGLAWSKLDALCIPLMCVENPLGYWSLQEEYALILLIRRLLLHPNARVVGQNFLYDAQYTAKHWGYSPQIFMDTMLAHHVCYLGTAKGLDFLSRLYCDFHCYWKDEGKEWTLDTPEEQLWAYNCKDAVVTYEASDVLEETVTTLKQTKQYAFIMSLFNPVLRMMLRGVKIDKNLRQELTMELFEHIAKREQIVETLIGRPVGKFINSPKQQREFFYDLLNLPTQYSKGKDPRPTCDDQALERLAKIEPLVAKLCYAVNEARTLKNSLSVINTQLDTDERMRCSYNIGGTETTRFSSSTNAFGNGTNLQNLTAGKLSEHTGLRLPNLRRLFVPNFGYVFYDVDLERADAQVVAWEADDAQLKQIFREGLDLHTENAKAIWGSHITSESPERQLAKVFCHAANYKATAKTLARALGITVHLADQILRKWFAAHPNILEWHKRIWGQLQETRQVQNAFGFRRLYFDRLDDRLLPQALAWIPQSTVAIVINKGLVAMDTHVPEAPISLQVHDSLAFQVPVAEEKTIIEKVTPHLLINVPYPDPLTIPIGFKVSRQSWGDCK